MNASDRQLRRVTRVASKVGQGPYVKNPRLCRGIVICSLTPADFGNLVLLANDRLPNAARCLPSGMTEKGNPWKQTSVGRGNQRIAVHFSVCVLADKYVPGRIFVQTVFVQHIHAYLKRVGRTRFFRRAEHPFG